MLFWVILIGANIIFWFLREYQARGSASSSVGVEQLFFGAIVMFVLTFFGVPALNFKSGEIIEVSDPLYFNLRFGALLLLCVVTPVHFFLIYLENRKHPK